MLKDMCAYILYIYVYYVYIYVHTDTAAAVDRVHYMAIIHFFFLIELPEPHSQRLGNIRRICMYNLRDTD